METQAGVHYWGIPLSAPLGEHSYPHTSFMTNKSVTPNKFPMVGIKAYTVNSLVSGEGILPSIRLMGIVDYNGVAFSMEWGRTFSRF